MARYFFHYRNEHGKLIEDRVGREHSCLAAIEEEAHRQASEIFEDEVLLSGADPEAPRGIEVVSEDGSEVLYMPFWASPLASAGNVQSEDRNGPVALDECRTLGRA